MFLKKIIKKDRQGNPKYVHYRLCESYRINAKVRHRTILNLGPLEGFDEFERKSVADRMEEILFGGKEQLFSSIPIKIEKIAQYFADLAIKQGFGTVMSVKDCGVGSDEVEQYREVDINSLENRDVQEIGAEWVVKQIMDRLEVRELLCSAGMDQHEADLSYIAWISRLVNPLSELGTEKWLSRNSGLCELMGLRTSGVTRYHLYNISRKLYKHKEVIEKHFSEKTRELFNLEEKIILFDLTNSYFEGRMMQSQKARFGRSKERRNDCKIIVLGLVTSKEGFVRHSKIYRGNMADCKTLDSTIQDLESNNSRYQKPTVVIDAGIATEKNLTMLKTKGYHYVCVSRAAVKEYTCISDNPYVVYDKNKEAIETKKVLDENSDDLYLYVKSPSKQKKEASIDEKLSERFEQGLQSISESLSKKRGIKTIEKIHERLGRLKSKYPRVAGSYTITTLQDQGKVQQLTWKRKKRKQPEEAGIYFIRTNYSSQTHEQVIWDVYNCIREIESSFRCLKTELSIRPNFHQKDENIEAHIHLGLLAYQVVSVMRHQLKQAGIRDSWRTLLSKMNTQKIMTTSFIDKQKNKVHIRNCSIPNAELKEIQQALKLKPVPFYRKKVVVPQK